MEAVEVADGKRRDARIWIPKLCLDELPWRFVLLA